MNNAGTVALLSVLLAGSNDEQKAKLTELYRNTFLQTEEYKLLNTLVNECVFNRGSGEDFYRKGVDAISEGMNDPTGFMHTLTDMKLVSESINRALAKTREYLQSAEIQKGDIDVIERKQEQSIRKFYLDLLEAMCFVGASLYGVDCIKDVNVDINASVFDIMNAVSSSCVKIEKAAYASRSPGLWVIRRRHFGGLNMVEYDGLVLSYENISYQINTGTKGVNPFITEPGNDGDVLCYGFGNMVIVDPTARFSLINSDVVTGLPLNFFDGADVDYKNFKLTQLISSRLHGGACVLDPGHVTALLNRYFMIQSVQTRKKAGLCPYCGKPLCRNDHFELVEDFEERFARDNQKN